MDDDDDADFVYEDDYSFSDGGLNDEEMRVELELDDSRFQLSQNKSQAIERLTEIARNHTIGHCIIASLDLMSARPTIDHFRLLIESIVDGPAETNGQEKLAIMDQGWSMSQQTTLEIKQDVVDAYVDTVQALQNSHEKRIYIKSLLLLISYFLEMGNSKRARGLLQGELRNAILQNTRYHWIADLKAEAVMLTLECEMSNDQSDLFHIHDCLENVESTKVNLSPVKVHSTEEIRARYYVQTHQLTEAKSLLKSAIRGYEETSGLQSHRGQFIRSVGWLIMVTTITEKCKYDLQTDLPTLQTLHVEGFISCALQMSQAFDERSFTKYSASRALIVDCLDCHAWKFASESLSIQLDVAFQELQMTTVLSSYSHIKWSTFENKLHHGRSPFNRTDKIFRNLQSDAKFDLDYRIDAVDQAIKAVQSPRRWAPDHSVSLSQTLLPRSYQDREIRQVQFKTEADISKKWQGSRTPTRMRPSKSASNRTLTKIKQNNDVLRRLQISMDKHREAMLK